MIDNNKNVHDHDLGLVSIVMNCYNGEKYLHEAIDSVISQTYQNWELIFWDNQSTDKSKAIFTSYQDNRLKYYYAKEHTDLGGARSQAFLHLSGDFIAVLDCDDLWLPKKLEKQLQLFEDEEIGVVISDVIFFNESNERAIYNGDYPPQGMVFRELLTGYFVSLVSLMLRKSVVDSLNYGFDSDFSFIADFDLVLRTAKISKLAIYKEVLAKWRIHEESDSWKSPISFCNEREFWIEKQIKKEPTFIKEYKKEIESLHNKNFLLMAVYSLSNNERINAIKFIFKTNFNDWHDYALLCFCFIPLSNKMIQFLQQRRIRQLLK
jgi:glycosyltransferase involved in cell wall biosynthesis